VWSYEGSWCLRPFNTYSADVLRRRRLTSQGFKHLASWLSRFGLGYRTDPSLHYLVPYRVSNSPSTVPSETPCPLWLKHSKPPTVSAWALIRVEYTALSGLHSETMDSGCLGQLVCTTWCSRPSSRISTSNAISRDHGPQSTAQIARIVTCQTSDSLARQPPGRPFRVPLLCQNP
jgi:hypothetical protein